MKDFEGSESADSRMHQQPPVLRERRGCHKPPCQPTGESLESDREEEEQERDVPR